nr:hypothetical protein [Tanacetum cinerariifolium]
MVSSSNRHGDAKTTLPRTTAEEITLCTAWCNAMDTVVYDSVRRMDENGSSDLVLFQSALFEHQTGYEQPFTMEACWRILKNHPALSEVEVPSYQRRNN